MLRKVFLYWHTIKYLKPTQLFFRIWKIAARPRPLILPAPKQRPITGTWIRPICSRTTLIEPDTFAFFGQQGSVSKIGWDGPEREKLWRYNQHYFADLVSSNPDIGEATYHALIKSWIENNPPGIGNGWEPYPSSLRITNWVKWALMGNTLSDLEQESLANQVRWLMKNLEWHILGNHLFVNAKALIFAGMWFDGPESQTWLERGFQVLEKQFPEQILPDGGQFELSPMYHALATEDVLDLVNICNCFQSTLSTAQLNHVETWETKLPAMQNWLKTMCHPDGEVSFFNDSAIGIAPHPEDIYAYANRLGLPTVFLDHPTTKLENSGYIRLENSSAVLLIDAARIGPDYLPGHAHADTLSFELSLYGQRVFVNSGTSMYGMSDERLRQRGTAAHNTVLIDGKNSSDIWGGFRVAKRAYPQNTKLWNHGESTNVEASHNGYRVLKDKPIHTRHWQFSQTALKICDNISKTPLGAEAHYHLHPDVKVVPIDEYSGHIHLSSGHSILWKSGGAPIKIKPSTWHPEFGTSQPNICLVAPLKNHTATFELDWT